MKLYEIGTLLLLVSLIESFIFVVFYSLLPRFRRGFLPWWKSFAGRVAFSLVCIMVLAFGLSWLALAVPLSLLVREWARIVIFGACAVWLAALLVGLYLAQRHARGALIRSETRQND